MSAAVKNDISVIAGDDGMMWYINGERVRSDNLPVIIKMEPNADKKEKEEDRQDETPQPETSEPDVVEDRQDETPQEYAKFARLRAEEKEAAAAHHQYVMQREAVRSRVLLEFQLEKQQEIDGSLQWLTVAVIGVNLLLVAVLGRMRD